MSFQQTHLLSGIMIEVLRLDDIVRQHFLVNQTGEKTMKLLPVDSKEIKL